MEKSKSWIGETLRLAGRGITALWLLLFYLFSIWLVLGALSSHLFQEKVQKVENSLGKKVTVAVVIEALREYDAIDRALEKNVQNLGNAEKKMQLIEAERNAKDIEYDKLLSEMNKIKSRLEDMLKTNGVGLGQFGLLSPDDVRKEDISGNGELNNVYNDYVSAYRKLDNAEQQLERLVLKLADAKSQTLRSRRNKHDFKEQRHEMILKYEDLRDHLSDLRYMRKLYFDRLAKMPNSLLTLILALSMGALGSVIFLTRTFLDPNTHRGFSWYLFRPFLGMVTAIAIFILAKAGQIVISDTPISQGVSSNLNPFFISFLAIISGILSEQAYERIHIAGSTFFHAESQVQERWAFRLREELESKNKNTSDISVFTDAPQKVVEDWIDEKYPVPEREQKLISVWLGRNIRDLFTDQPPPS